MGKGGQEKDDEGEGSVPGMGLTGTKCGWAPLRQPGHVGGREVGAHEEKGMVEEHGLYEGSPTSS